MATEDDPRLLNKQQLAKYLGVSVRSIEYRMRDGLPYIAVGHCKRFDRTEVVEWLRQRTPGQAAS